MVDLEPLIVAEDVEEVRKLLHRHVSYTGSTVAGQILKQWDATQPKFVKVIPKDYKRAINAMKRAQFEGIPWEQAVMEGAHG
jgi:glutamate synthase domain-containing protein 3